MTQNNEVSKTAQLYMTTRKEKGEEAYGNIKKQKDRSTYMILNTETSLQRPTTVSGAKEELEKKRRDILVIPQRPLGRKGWGQQAFDWPDATAVLLYEFT